MSAGGASLVVTCTDVRVGRAETQGEVIGDLFARSGGRCRAPLGVVGYALLLFVVGALVVTPSLGAAPSDLVAAYAFGEGAGTSVGDVSGQGNAGSVIGASWTTAGKFGSALSFNGTSSRVAVPDAAGLDLTAGGDGRGMGLPGGGSDRLAAVVQKEPDSYFLHASSGAVALRPAGGVTVPGGIPGVYSPTSLPVGTWSHLALTYDGSTLRLYVNGTQVATAAATGAISPSASPLSIGGTATYGEWFNGRIDEVRVYRVALSQAEIQADMAAPLGGPVDSSPPTAPSGLVAGAVSSSRIDLSWSAASDNVGVTGYEVERCQGAGCSGFAAGDDGADVGVE